MLIFTNLNFFRKTWLSWTLVLKIMRYVAKSPRTDETQSRYSINEVDLNGSKMAVAKVKKINNVVNFLYRQANFIPKCNRKLLCNTIAMCSK